MNILVYGWYHSGNIGDDLFREAFAELFSSHSFYYTKEITKNNLEGIDAVFFGGGSLLDGKPSITSEASILLEEKKIFYIGVGTETNIHPIHQSLMGKAKLIASRSRNIDNVKNLNANCIQIPDLVYALKDKRKQLPTMPKSIIVLPNIELVAKWNDPYWKNISWEYFKTQFAQFLDEKVEDGYTLDFLSMCSNNTMNDNWASTEIINKMKNRRAKFNLLNLKSNFVSLTHLLSQYSVIISQRFHGVILAEILDKPYIAIHHHDKIKNCYPGRGNFIPYYEISKHKLVENFLHINQLNDPIDMNFKELKKRVEILLTSE